jgi:putative hydrolase of the HAD superfamily
LRALQVKPEEAVFIGDSPLEDIDGAKKAGLRTIFVPSPFNTLRDMEESGVRSDLVFHDLAEVNKRFPEIANST